MSNNNNSNINNSKINDKKKSFDPTIGDAVKEAIETHKEVKVAGPAEVGNVAEIEKNAINKNDDAKVTDNETNIIVDETLDSKLEINVKDPEIEIPSNENRIIVKPDDSESNVESITTIPADQGVEVEIHTEVEVPVKDKDKSIESDLKVEVHSHGLSTEIPLASNEGPNEFLNKNEYNYSSTPRPLDVFENVYENTARNTFNVAKNYIDLKYRSFNSFQNAFNTMVKNTNDIFLNHQNYCTNMSEIYAKILAENTISYYKIFRHIFSMNMGLFKN